MVAANNNLKLFLLVTFLFSWLCWLPLALSYWGIIGVQLPAILGLVGALGPGVGAIVASRASHNRQTSQLFKKILIWRVGWPWYLAAFLNAVILVTGFVVCLALSDVFPFFKVSWPADVTLIAVVVATLIQAPNTLFEELGWRGYLLPGLQNRFDALKASLIVGIIWVFWHLPYWLSMSDNYRFGGLMFLLNALYIVPLSILLAWLVNNTGGSVLMAWLVHLSSNVAGTFIPFLAEPDATPGRYLLTIVLVWLVAGAIVLLFGAKRLAKPKPVGEIERKPPLPELSTPVH